MDNYNMNMGMGGMNGAGSEFKKPSFISSGWFWLMIIGFLVLAAGVLLMFTSWVSNNLYAYGALAVGALLLIVGIILLVVSRGKNQKKEQEFLRQKQLQAQQNIEQVDLQAQQAGLDPSTMGYGGQGGGMGYGGQGGVPGMGY